MSMKQYWILATLMTTVACGSIQASQKDEDVSGEVSYPVLSEESLIQEMEKGSRTLDKALSITAKNPKAVIEVEGKYYAWMSQCLDQIAAENESRLWRSCLHFTSRLLKVEVSGESAGMLVPVFKQQRKKWDVTLKSLEDADQDFLMSQVQAGLALTVE